MRNMTVNSLFCDGYRSCHCLPIIIVMFEASKESFVLSLSAFRSQNETRLKCMDALDKQRAAFFSKN